jgi:Tfp pilus assembly protein PilN
MKVLGHAGSDQTGQVRVQSTAAHRDRIASLLAAADRAGLNVAGISATPAALTVLAQKHLGSEKTAAAVLYVDEAASTLIVLSDGSPCVTTELPMGLSSLTVALMRPIIDGERVIQLDEAQATTIRNTIGIPTAGQAVESLGVDGQRLAPLIEPTLQKFAKHLVQWLKFAATTMDQQKIGHVRLIGPGAGVPNLGQGIAARIDCEVRPEQWLRDTTISSQAGQSLSADRCAAILGVAKHGAELPELLPPEMQLRRRLNRVRKSVTVCSLIVAAAALGLAVLFDQIHARLQPSVELQQRHLPAVQEVVAQNQRWEQQEGAVRRLEAQFDEVAASSPMWSGLFKELAVRLPLEVRAKELSLRRADDGIKLTLNGEVLVRKDGGGFDPVVEKTLLQLQRSPFFKRVQLLGASREAEEGKEAAGALLVEMDLICPGGSSRM